MAGRKFADLNAERKKVEKAHPGLAESYQQFQKTFASYREVEAQFKKPHTTVAAAGARLRA